MDWTTPNSLKRPTSRKKRAHFGKSTSEPNLLGHFTPRFPDNLTHLLHEYVTVDELKFYRKRRPPNIGDEFHSKDSICLYDKSRPITPFSALKSEYNKEFGKIYSPRSRSVPNKFNLNATTKELLDALKDDLNDFTPIQTKRATSAKLSGELEIQSGDSDDNKLLQDKIETDPASGQKKNDSPQKLNKDLSKGNNNRRTRVFKVQGEFRCSSDFNSGEFRGQMERAESMNNIEFHGNFHGTPEYRESFKSYNHFTKSAPIKAKDHLRVNPICVNTAVISPSIASSSLSEYTDKYKEIDLRTADFQKISKQMSNVAMRNNLMIGHSDAHIFPEYFESFKDPNVKKRPDKGKPLSPILSLNGSMDYNPEYRVKFTEFPRQRPAIQRAESHFDFFDRPRKPSPVHHAIIAPKFNPNVAIVEPSKQNVHQPLPSPLPSTITINKNPSYLCQPEVRKARHEVLIKKRPPSPHQTISAAIRNVGRPAKLNEDEENKCYNERSHIVTTPVKPPPVQVVIDNFDEPTEKPTTLFPLRTPLKPPSRRVSMQTPNFNTNSYAKRNHCKIIEGNHEYTKKRTSLLSTTTEEEFTNGDGGGGGAGGISARKLVSSHSLENPSFVVLNDRMKQNKWMKSTWYL